MLIEEQIAYFVPLPLRGENIEEFCVHFPDMSHIYDEDLKKIVRKNALNNNIQLKDEGICSLR